KILVDGTQATTTTVDSNGSFTVNLPADVAGSHTIQAVFDGSAHFKNSGSSSLSVQVNKLAANLALTLPTTPVEYGASFTIKATATGPADAASPSGTVDLSNSSGKFASLTLNSSGTATWQSPASPWAVGSYNISAAYGGDTRFGGVTAPAATIQVVKAATSLTLATSTSQVSYGGPVDLTGKLTSSTGAATTGSIVKILVDGKNSASATVASDGSFGLSLPGLGTGSHTIQAVFDGSAVFAGSSSQNKGIEIAKATGDLTLSVPSKIVFGQKVQLVATLKSTYADAFKSASVIFYDGTRELGRSPVSNGSASFLLTAIQTGKTFDFKAAIAESVDTKPAASGNTPIIVNKADVAISWVALPPPRKGRPSPGWTIKITPSAPGAGSPAGSITLNLANKRAKPKVIAINNGSAVYKFTGNLNKPVKISYVGNTNFNSAIFNV
ncbi:MAG: Ig-like domain-containing protein, partial [bacterium]